eukprot:CAMPEP_0204148030 /NCGR_PEP_ID=MMETSP0361-20130328/23216_1 /ASSEMBLY_ACC=CAM_ASM_000343 /TAXON_ID=268821 /ORGANISM="Scrippsiella Hangoei, Strain SHTV-5" /LENGTH=333 /DNA_ID=CAMNT_0051102315 /DNA_START=58 /DNA_END=1059 /DNA_ORIENTATION=-
MVISRRIVHLSEMLASGRSMTAHVSSNGETHSEKIKVLVRPPSAVAHPAESCFMQAVLQYLLQISQSWRITDRGHTHSDGSVEVEFFLKHADPRRSRSQPIGALPDSAQDVPADPGHSPNPGSIAPVVSENPGREDNDAAKMHGFPAAHDPFVGAVPGLESTRPASSSASSVACPAVSGDVPPGATSKERRVRFNDDVDSALTLCGVSLDPDCVSAKQRVAEMKLKCCQDAVQAIRKCIESNIDILQSGLAEHGSLHSAGFRAQLREGMAEPMIKFMVDGIVGTARKHLLVDIALDFFYREDMVEAVDAQTESLSRLVIDFLLRAASSSQSPT